MLGHFTIPYEFSEFWRELTHIREDIVECIIFFEECDGCFGADSLHAWDIVGSISDKSEIIDYLCGVHFKLLYRFLFVVHLILHRVIDIDMSSDKLEEIFIRGNYENTIHIISMFHRECSHDIICFIAWNRNSGDSE